MNSGQRSRIGFIGSIVTHIFILLFVSFVGLFNLSHPPANDIVEVSLFGGGGGGGQGQASADGEGKDEFVFQISKDEYLDLLFEDLPCRT